MKDGPILHVVFRAEFSGPKGALNPSGFKLPGRISVEIAESNGVWVARRPGTKNQFPITHQPSADALKGQMFHWFEKQETEWEPFVYPSFGPAVRIDANHFYLDDKGRYRERFIA